MSTLFPAFCLYALLWPGVARGLTFSDDLRDSTLRVDFVLSGSPGSSQSIALGKCLPYALKHSSGLLSGLPPSHRADNPMVDRRMSCTGQHKNIII